MSLSKIAHIAIHLKAIRGTTRQIRDTLSTSAGVIERMRSRLILGERPTEEDILSLSVENRMQGITFSGLNTLLRDAIDLLESESVGNEIPAETLVDSLLELVHDSGITLAQLRESLTRIVADENIVVDELDDFDLSLYTIISGLRHA